MHDPRMTVRARVRPDLLAVLGIAAVLRIVVLLAAAGSPQRYWSQDDRDYLGLAFHLHAGYVAGAGQWFDVGLRRTPVYPLVLRAVFDVFGRHYVAVVAVQVLIATATVGLTFWLARLVLPERYAVGAALLIAIDPASIVFANQMLTETLFALLITVGVGLIVIARRRGDARLGVAAGLILGLSALTRPVAEYLPLAVAPAIVLAPTAIRRSSVIVALAVVVGFAVPTGAWVARNDVKTGVPVLSTIDGHNMLQYRAVGALVEEGEPRSLAQHDVLVRLAPHVHPGDNAAEISRAELGVGLAILGEHPRGAFKDWARGEGRLLVGPAKSETASLLTGRDAVHGFALRTLVLVDQLITLAIVLAAAAGFVGMALGRIRIPSLWVLAATALYLIVVSGGHEAYSRFRVPVTPLLVVLGVAAFAELRRARVRPA